MTQAGAHPDDSLQRDDISIFSLRDEVALLNAFGDSQALILGGATRSQLMEHVASLVPQMLPHRGAAISVRAKPKAPCPLVLQAWSDERTRAVASVIEQAGIGPMFDALETKTPVVSDDLSNDARWGELLVPPVSVVSMPVMVDDDVVATMCLYGPVGGETPEQVERMLRIARHAGTLIAGAKMFEESRQLADNLRAAMQNRAVIEQAKGIVMGTRLCTEDEAFAYLRDLSQHQNLKLREVAERLVKNTTEGHQI